MQIDPTQEAFASQPLEGEPSDYPQPGTDPASVAPEMTDLIELAGLTDELKPVERIEQGITREPLFAEPTASESMEAALPEDDQPCLEADDPSGVDKALKDTKAWRPALARTTSNSDMRWRPR